MQAAATLTAIMAALVAASYALGRGSWDAACLYLLGLTAPLEVYRTEVHDVYVSVFRLAVLVAVATAAWHAFATMRTGGRPRVPTLGRVGWSYVILLGALLLSFAVHGEALLLGRRLAAILVIGVAVIAAVRVLAARTSPRVLAEALVAGASLAVLAAAWQVLGPRLGADGALPFLRNLPVGEGLAESRDLTASLGGAGDRAVAVRLQGTSIDPNHFGTYLVIVTLVAISLAVEARAAADRARALAFACIAVAAGATLLATYSRSAWGAAVVAATVMVTLLAPVLRSHTTRRQQVVAAGAIAVFLAGLVIALGPTIAARLDPESRVNSTTNAVHRANVDAGIRIFADRPLLGLGVGNLGQLLGQRGRQSGADSTYITVAAQLGAIGLFALLLTAGYALQAAGAAYRRARGRLEVAVPAALLAGYAGFLVANVVYDQLWWRDFHIVVVGLIAALGARGETATSS